MGWRYVSFRLYFEASKKLGFLKWKYPVDPPIKSFISLEAWRKNTSVFFFDCKESINLNKNPNPILREKIQRLKNGEFLFFNAEYKKIGNNYNWISNPESGYNYPLSHWLDINDFSSTAGDIKFVWEKSRFSYLCTIIRYDYHFDEDCSEWVFKEIDSWIQANPVNLGPNYKCSQEISIRMLNWLFALYYYRFSPSLTQDRFQKIMHSCFWQLSHVRQNIHFSRIAVRNNHAITESLMLYLGGVFYALSKGISATLIALIVSLQPILTSFLAKIFLNETLTRYQWIGIFLGFSGASIIIISDLIGLKI